MMTMMEQLSCNLLVLGIYAGTVWVCIHVGNLIVTDIKNWLEKMEEG